MTSHFFQSLPGRLLIGGLAYRNARHTVEERVIAQLASPGLARPTG